MSDIKVIKLVSGESVISDTEVVDNGYILKNPTVVIPTPEGLGMMELSPFGVGKNISICKQHVLFTDDVEEEIKNVYNQKFGTGIITASGFNVIRPSR